MFRYLSTLVYCLGVITAVNAHVAMVYPKGGEMVQAGGVLDIRWEIIIEHETLNWDLYFTLDDGASWFTIKEDIAVKSLGYSWEVPNINSKTVKIRVVQDNQLGDYDDITKNFTISGSTTSIAAHKEINLILDKHPVTDVINISTGVSRHKDVDIFSLQGQKVMHHSTSDEIISMNIQGLVPDIYVIIVSGDSRRGVRKFIKL